MCKDVKLKKHSYNWQGVAILSSRQMNSRDREIIKHYNLKSSTEEMLFKIVKSVYEKQTNEKLELNVNIRKNWDRIGSDA